MKTTPYEPTEVQQITEGTSASHVLNQDHSGAAIESMGGFQLAGYNLESRLGSGGYGEVWKAIGPGGLPKAVKILYGERDGAHAEAEFKALERMRELRHPFLLNIERIEVVNRRLIVVTELADGNLADRFEQCREQGLPGIPREQLLQFLRDAADALDFMSQKHGLQHLDIKPDNILVQGDHAKVGDFGLAKDLTATNVSLMNGFTPTYAAPELFEGRPGKWSDQYSLAIVYQFLLTGSLPFNGRTAAQLTVQHLRSQPDLSGLQPVDRPVIARALSRNARSRYDSCRQLIDELSRRHASRIRAPLSSGSGDTDAATSDTDMHQTVFVKTAESTPVHIAPEPDTGQPLRRCAVVGIGGVGAAVLGHLKTLLQSDENQTSCPVLHIDSHKEGAAEFPSGQALTADERLIIPLRSSKEYRAARDLELSWLSRRWLFNIPRSQKVEGIRPLGRLALYDHRQKTKQALQHLIQQAVDGSGTADEPQQIDVFLVAATSGGTGSGTVTDVGLLVRDLQAQFSAVELNIHGVLLHGTGAHRGNADVQEANTLAVLKELHHLNTPGLGTPRGFQNLTTDLTPFDDAALIHMGDGLTADRIDSHAENTAGFLYSAVATGAQRDYHAWRKAELTNDKTEPTFQLMGVLCKDPDAFSSTSREAMALAHQLIRHWMAPVSIAGGAGSIAAATDALLHELMLTPDTLLPQIDSLLKGNIAGDLAACAHQLTAQVSPSDGTSLPARRAFIEQLSTQLRDCDSASEFSRVIGGLRASLSQITAKCRQTVARHLTSQLDSPYRINGMAVAIRTTGDTLTATLTACREKIEGIRKAFDHFCADCPDDAVPPEKQTLIAQELVCLVGYEQVYECFVAHLNAVSEEVSDLTAHLKQLVAQLRQCSAARDADENQTVPEPVIDALDKHARRLQPGLFRRLWDNTVSADEWTADVVRLTARFLSDARRHTASGAATSAADGDFPKNVWPRLRGVGGRRRVLGVVPCSADTEELKNTLKHEFGDCVAVRQETSIPCALTVCETSNVAMPTLLDFLCRTNPHAAEISGRIHTRIDVDW